MKPWRFLIPVLLLLLVINQNLWATHLRAGEITVTRNSCNGLTFTITITAYTNTGSPVKFSDGTLDFGDGSNSLQTPTRDNIIRPELGAGIGFVQYSTSHTFPGPGYYTISYKERNRNANILNMSNSVNTQFYLETVIIIDPFIGCDNSPVLLVPPIDKGCTGGAWYHNPGAYDPDGDSLSYEFTIPKQDKNIPVNAYRDPNDKGFYDRIGIDYSKANETQDGAPTFTINPRTGTILWNAPGAPGEYNIAFRVIQWRKIGGVFKQIGYVTRDMQIIIEDCLNKRPELKVPPDICVEAGTIINEDIFGTDPDFDSVKIEAFSQAFIINPSPAVFFSPRTDRPNQSFTQFTSPTKNAVLKFQWNTTCSHVKEQPYQVVFKISDRSKRGPSLVQFKTWNIRIVGPAPKWQTASVDVPSRSALLKWDKYVCQNATSIEVYRRVGPFPFTPPPCVTGIPDFLGYTKIATLPIGSTQYTNTGLAAGSQYCYRLVAVFPQPQGGNSYVSQEICIPPFPITKAVITNVTVDKTSTTTSTGQPVLDGQITIKWRSPFEDPNRATNKDYKFKLYRAEGFSGRNRIVEVFPGFQEDSTAIDNGINTKDIIYNYRVLSFTKNNLQLDSSAVASSVRLEAKPEFEQIRLTWAAVVPWSNNTSQFPIHEIYRVPSGTSTLNPSQLTKIADLNVNQYKFTYIDSGQVKGVFNGVKLKNGQEYCYVVKTRGSYGNPKIQSPLENFSQITCAVPDDKVPPCVPDFTENLNGTDCTKSENNPCGQSDFYTNTLTWKRPFDPDCKLDIKGYYIYYASNKGGTFAKLEDDNRNVIVVTDTVFVHKKTGSFAGCYKISAVDRAGNESELSEERCFDNCPYYELPNVFTPNGDGCNDVFSAYSIRNVTPGEIVKIKCNDGTITADQFRELQSKCARFVNRVIFTVYNRWGGVVYTYESSGEKSIYIDWDGRDNNKGELSTGVYYYEAQVTFNVVDPSKQNKTIKGWVQIIR
jgi:CHU_C Type IX secretion signal domain